MNGNLGPPGACDACGRACGTLDQVGVRCFHCHDGVFMGRRWWNFWQDNDGVWWGTPREDIDIAALEAERAMLNARSETAADAASRAGYTEPSTWPAR